MTTEQEREQELDRQEEERIEREVRNPAGDVLLLREGRPVPEGFQ